MAEVLGRSVSVRMLLVVAAVALATGIGVGYLVMYLPTLQPPAFQVVDVNATAGCQGRAPYYTSCPLQVTLRNKGGTGTALLIVREGTFNYMTNQSSTVICSTAVPRAERGELVNATCTVLAGPDSWLQGSPTMVVRQ